MKEGLSDYIGDLKVGRKNLGEEMPVVVYRLFEFTMKESIIERFGRDIAIEIFREAGKKAGRKLSEQLLDSSLDFIEFINTLKNVMISLKMGILRVEETDHDHHHIVVTVSEDLDCSGLPVTNETVCNYDEGFLMGVLKEYTGCDYDVVEIDCWAKGGRTCRFKADLQ